MSSHEKGMKGCDDKDPGRQADEAAPNDLVAKRAQVVVKANGFASYSCCRPPWPSMQIEKAEY
eukprot:scaffold271632_cov33-Prasinocladus_malaysianus.AAC.1